MTALAGRKFVEATPRVPASCPNGHRHFYLARAYGIDAEIVWDCLTCEAEVDLFASFPKDGEPRGRKPRWVRGTR